MTTRRTRWWGQQPVICEMCGRRLVERFVDARSVSGQWAIMCQPCHRTWGARDDDGAELVGQTYELSEDQSWF